MGKQFVLAVIAATIFSTSVAAQEGMEDGHGPTGIEIAKGIHLIPGLSCNVIAVTGSKVLMMS